MKKFTLILILMFFIRSLPAPGYERLVIVESDPVQVFDPMLWAFQKVESNFRADIVNYLGYTGMLQEGQEMIDEANRINVMTGNPMRFTFPASALDSLQSTQIWYIVQQWHNPSYDLRRACKVWNPLASEKYYLKIKKNL